MSEPTPETLEPRRSQVIRLLRAAETNKSAIAMGSDALRQLEEAYTLAKTEPEVPAPWPGMVAYRLAHLLLRTDCDQETLANVDKLFAEAADVKSYKTLAPIYRIPVLHRLWALTKDEDVASQLDRVFQQVRQNIRGHSEVHMSGPNGRADDVGRFPLQTWLFNMLELSTYFTQRPYDELLGLGERPEWALRHGHWVIVGPERDMGGVRFARELALEELQAREKRCEGRAVFFKLGDGESLWKRAGTTTYSTAVESHLKMLALLLYRDIESEDRLRRKILGPNDDQSIRDNFRQMKTRLKRALKRLLEMDDGTWDIFKYSPETGRVELCPDLVVYGAVDVHHL